ncbi:MAG: 2-polyprenylphenol 6-hydroxylase [Rickettsiaceae bacterium]|nr:2-polyprenylphenol 6-hydroxylase [Rickettsiaceae bacterium]
MLKFCKNLPRLLKVVSIVSKYKIFTYPDQINIPKSVRFLAKLAEIITHPINSFTKPEEIFGKRLANCFRNLGPIYIKFGQTLSTRPDLVSANVANSLTELQDKLPPFASNLVRETIEAEFNQKISEIFVDFNDIPVAAASIAQVHKAKLIDGTEVAVKVLRPNIFVEYNKDVEFLGYLATILSKWFIQTKRLKLIDVVKVFHNTMKSELNLRMEAAAASRLTDSFNNDPSVKIPKIYWHLTSEQVITLEWIQGVSIYDTKAIIKQGLNPREIAANIAVMFFNQAYRDGFFHADLHPGNILVCKDGAIALVDFGIIGMLKEKDRLAIAEILHAFLQRDYSRVAIIHHRVKYIPQDTDLELFAQSCRSIAEPIMGLKIKDISIGNLLARLFKITDEFGMETQPQLLLLQKTMVVVEGIGQSLHDEINMWELAAPWIQKWANKNLTPEAKFVRILKILAENLLDKTGA